jgi:hypothetical protein
MKKISINLLGILLATTMFLSCGNSSDNNPETNNNTDNSDFVAVEENNEVVDNEIEDVIDFSKFEHYATISTKTDLIARFGEENLADITVSYAEGTVVREATVLTNPQNGHVIQYVWEDDNVTISFIEAFYNVYNQDYELLSTQELEAENGLSLGMSLSELVDWNGDDFQFSGFGWDYAGGIYGDENSKITNSPVALTLDLLSFEGAEFTIGDVELSSSDSRLDDVDIIVSDFTMYID